MNSYKLTVHATRGRFMERPLHDVSEWYVVADSRTQAHDYVWGRLTGPGGWTINKIDIQEIHIFDIRSGNEIVIGCEEVEEE